MEHYPLISSQIDIGELRAVKMDWDWEEAKHSGNGVGEDALAVKHRGNVRLR